MDRLPIVSAGCQPALQSLYTGGLPRFVYPVAWFAALAIGAWAGAPQASTSKSTTKKKAKKAVVVAHRSVVQPTPERYKEIQQALADKGYFRSEPDGAWGPSSIDALKRFQHDQNLAEDGKIGSLSLIALGLGPKRDTNP
jgi:peptidoglycan hydrolase-like protein with peptidoglycan-binding domain